MLDANDKTVWITDQDMIDMLYGGAEPDEKVMMLKGVSMSVTIPDVLFEYKNKAIGKFGNANIDIALDTLERMTKLYMKTFLTGMVIALSKGDIVKFLQETIIKTMIMIKE